MIETILTLSDTKEARRDRRNPYEMHRTLERVFTGTPGRMLWRLDGEELTLRVEAIRYAVQGLGIQMSLPNDYASGLKTVVNELKSNTHDFRLLANPVVTRQGKQHNLVGHAAQIDWLMRKAKEGGFTLLDCVVKHSRNHLPKNPKGISIIATEFRGVLRVVDEERFQHCLVAGIGRGKAFGLGLLKLGQYATETGSQSEV